MKIFRDPIHNVINLDTKDKATNNLLVQLIDSKEFQRLRSLKQLGFAYLVYPSATHTRFEHSLGVAFLTKKFIEHIIGIRERILGYHPEESAERKKFVAFFDQTEQDKNLAIVAALLHDIGHGPLSHVLEKFTNGIKHEDWTREIILGNTEVNSRLKEYNSEYPQKVCDLLTNANHTSPVAKILAGQIDVDRIDYMLRDAHMTGAQYGNFDVEWLYNVLTVGIVKDNVEIGIDLGKGISIVEDFVMARIYMYKNIYFHTTNLVAQAMLKRLFQRIRELPPNSLSFIDENLKNIFLMMPEEQADKKKLLSDYLSISDIDLFYCLKKLQHSDDSIVRVLSAGLLNRCLFKKIDPKQLAALQAFIGAKFGEEEHYYIAPIEMDLEEGRLAYSRDKKPIYLFDKNGKGHDIVKKSEIVRATLKTEVINLGDFVEQGVYEQFICEQTQNPNIGIFKLSRIMDESIFESERCLPEDDREHPKVGAVLCNFKGEIILRAYRGEWVPDLHAKEKIEQGQANNKGSGDHCEYLLLEKAKKEGINLQKSILFVTLEPCTKRSHEKVPCAERIIQSKIPIVYIGTLDPNGAICGKGQLHLQDGGVEVLMYKNDHVKRIKKINEKFEKYQKSNASKIK